MNLRDLFSSYRQVSNTALRRVEHYPRTSQGFVVLPDYDAVSYKEFLAEHQRPIPIQALFPFISTREDVLQAYPAAPTQQTKIDVSHSSQMSIKKKSNKSLQMAHKRTRQSQRNEQITTLLSINANGGTGKVSSTATNPQSVATTTTTTTTTTTKKEDSLSNKNAIVEPVMHFANDFSRTDYLGRSFLTPPAALLQLYDNDEHAKIVNSTTKGATRTQKSLHTNQRGKHDNNNNDASNSMGVIKPCTPPKTLRGVFKVVNNNNNNNNTTNNDKEYSNIDSNTRKMLQEAGGIQQLHWAPPRYGHLLFSADLHGKVQLWDALTSRNRIATFNGHATPIKSLCVISTAQIMSTCSVDGRVILWDVETGICDNILTNPQSLPVVQHLHHPTDQKNWVLAALDKKIVLYDVRISTHKFQREYTGHMGTIFNLTLLSNGNKLLTTSQDRTLRTWDFRIPVQIKQFADANMHAITHVLQHPFESLLAAQSLDNKIIVFQDDGGGKLKMVRGRQFSSHTISGTRCQLAFSRDGRYVSSGDINGKLFIWDWNTGTVVKSFKAHSQMLVSHLWHPLQPSRMVTSSWDGTIKMWV